MHAICTVVYGIPLNLNGFSQPARGAELDELIAEESDGFIRQYSGSGDPEPSAFGVVLSSFDESRHHVDLEGSGAPRLAASAAQRAEFDAAFAALDPEIRREMSTLYGAPRSFLLWSSS